MNETSLFQMNKPGALYCPAGEGVSKVNVVIEKCGLYSPTLWGRRDEQSWR